MSPKDPVIFTRDDDDARPLRNGGNLALSLMSDGEDIVPSTSGDDEALLESTQQKSFCTEVREWLSSRKHRIVINFFVLGLDLIYLLVALHIDEDSKEYHFGAFTMLFILDVVSIVAYLPDGAENRWRPCLSDFKPYWPPEESDGNEITTSVPSADNQCPNNQQDLVLSRSTKRSFEGEVYQSVPTGEAKFDHSKAIHSNALQNHLL